MKSLVLTTVMVRPALCLALMGGYGCNPTEILPACRDVDLAGMFPDYARLTGAPTFSSLEIAPGDPLSIAVPVDANTRSVSVLIRSQDLPGVGAGGDAETNGGEIVDVLVGDTNLPAGIYFANRIDLEGDRPGNFAVYTANSESQYILSIAAQP